jgi:hypothetical protein
MSAVGSHYQETASEDFNGLRRPREEGGEN